VRLLGLCFDDAAHGVGGHYDPWLALLSYGVAAFASYTALEMTGRLRTAPPGSQRFWHLSGALALGGGVWSMHFIAMLAFKAPIEQAYDPALTLASGVLAIVAVAVGLTIFERPVTPRRLAAAGLLVGLGVVAMHYCGMAALRIPGEIRYRTGLFAASVFIAVAAATVALWLAYTLRSTHQRGFAALVMAVAIVGMHYTGMAAAVIVVGPHAASAVRGTVNETELAVGIAVGVAVILLLGLVCAYVDRRLELQAKMEAERLRKLNAELAERTETLTRALADVDEARRRAEAASQVKSAFLTSMNHEFRTPLNAVMGFAEVMKLNAAREPLTVRQRESLDQILGSAQQLLDLVEGVLDLVRSECGEMTTQIRPTAVGGLLRHACDAVAGEAERFGVTLSCELGLPALTVMADADSLERALAALMSNAVKYNRPGGAVRVRSAVDGDKVRVSVSDDGQGIPSERLSELFEPFNRLGRETGVIPGVGVSLAAARRLIEAMGGALEVDSIEGVGSTFTLVLAAEAETDAPALMPSAA
jgi:NO-binding membrane sensor protein with MHYT domain/nitrogen-specific signal transduction histidine kinase